MAERPPLYVRYSGSDTFLQPFPSLSGFFECKLKTCHGKRTRSHWFPVSLEPFGPDKFGEFPTLAILSRTAVVTINVFPHPFRNLPLGKTMRLAALLLYGTLLPSSSEMPWQPH